MGKRPFALVAALICLLFPPLSAAQDGFGFWSSSGSPTNPDNSYDYVGIDSTGEMQLLTSGGTANTLSASWTSLGTTSGAWTALRICTASPQAATNRYMVDLSFDGGTTTNLANAYWIGGSTTTQALSCTPPFPIRVSAGATISAKIRSSGTSQAFRVAVVGEIGASGLGYNQCDSLISDTTNTRAGNVDLTGSTTTSWQQLIASTANTYGALVAVLGERATAPSNGQRVALRLATGAAASETEIYRFPATVGTTAPAVVRAWSGLISKSIPLGTRITASPLVGNAGANDIYNLGLWGCH